MLRLFSFLLLIIVVNTNINAQTVVINEFGSLNSKILDEENDSPDWLELYNTGTESVNLLNYAISDDSTDLLKWTFPDIDLAGKKAMYVFASGKDRREIIYYRNLINQGDEFSYAIGSAIIPTNWNTSAFDASAWATGPSGFGYGDNDDATDIAANTLSVFIRKTFTINDLASAKELIFHVDYDDGFVAYINGVEIGRANLGIANTTVAYNQTADTYTEPLMTQGLSPEKYTITDIESILKEGENILAIQCHNNSTTSSDLTIIPFLSIGYNSPVEGNEVPEILNLYNKTLHTNFKITADGEKLYLCNASGTLIDQSDSIVLPTDISYGRSTSDINNWLYYSEPTPGLPNSTQGYDSIGSQAIQFSKIGGRYSSTIQVSLTSTSGADIYYTTDGNNPDASSKKYTSSINISSSTTLKATSVNNSLLALNPSVQSYIIENRKFEIPILAISTEPDNLFDYNYGIYEKGPNAETSNPYFGSNFWMDWERPVYLEYLNTAGEKVFESPAGVKIFGAWSRANEQKSMAFFARKAYGPKSFKYPFFAELENSKYKSFVIRNSGNDWTYTSFRDAFMTHLLEGVDIDYQAYQPSAIYINGEYWGLLNLREKINEEYLADHHGVNPDEVDILEANGAVVEGTNEHYLNMMQYIENNDITKTAIYDSVCNLMDIENFMEYQIAQIYFDNGDWPGNNIKFWRPQTPNGKWRWLLYDTDFGFNLYGDANYLSNTLDFATATNGPSWPNPPWSTYLLRRLLQNAQFKHDFINRFADRINSNFMPSVVNHLVDSLSSSIDEEMPYHSARWNHIWDFNGNVDKMRSFGEQRPSYMRGFIKTKFSLKALVNLTVNTNNVAMGTVNVNSLTLTKFPWSGKYYNGNTVSIKAVAKPGFEFSHWDGSDKIAPEIEVNIPTAGLSIKAIFVESTLNYNSIVINEINYNSSDPYNTGDWFELKNASETSIDISGWTVYDYDTNSYVIPNGTVINAKDYLVVCRNKENFNQVYPSIACVIGDFSFGLSSTYDMLKLYDKQNLLIDSVLYQSESPWPVISGNQTISLINPYSDNSVGTSWDVSISAGTPGTHNDYFTDIKQPETKLSKDLAHCFPNPTKNSATIRWTCDSKQQVAINIYNTDGRLVTQLFNHNCNLGSYEETWDSENQQAGIYIIQLSFSDGKLETLKLIKY